MKQSLTENKTTKKVQPSITGNIDKYDAGVVTGWAFDKSHPETRLKLKVYCDKAYIGEGLADKFRVDLVAAGMGDGKHAFEIKVSSIPADGNSHCISIIEGESGERIATHDVTVEKTKASITISGVEWGHLHGEVINLEVAAQTIPLTVLDETGELITQGNATIASHGNYHFNMALPTQLMDGMPHLLTVTLPGHPGIEASYIDVLPSMFTPWEHLVTSAKGLNYSALSRTAGYRYDSLKKNLEILAEGTIDSATIANLMTAHHSVVEGYDGRSKYPVLALPKHDIPDVSIVIPVHNKFNLTYHCLASLILAHNRASYEVIVVDDVSTDETTAITDYVNNVRVIVNEQNLGFLRNCNKAVNEARGRFVVMLNNDTEVTSGWLDALLDTFERFEGVGMAGSKLIYPDGKLQEAGGIVWSDGQPWNLGNGGNPQAPEWNYARQVDYLSGAAIMLPRAIWTAVGGFSEEFAPAYYEDTDLAFKVREAGYKTVYAPHSVVIHFEGMSNGRDISQGIKKNQAINAPKFRAKWIDRCLHNGRASWENVWEHKERNVAYRVLMIDYATPRPDHDAGSYAAVQEMRMLQANGCKITFVAENLAHMGKYTDDLQKMGVECLYAPYYSSIHQVLQKRGKEFDLVYITRYDIAEHHVDHVRQLTNAKIMFNNADLHFLRELRAALASGNKDLTGPLATRDRELALMRRVDAILTYNSTEQAVILSHNLHNANLFTCPWVLNIRGHKTPFSQRNGIAFLGGYNHKPNVEAVEFFTSQVMPLLREQLPGVAFHIYGSRMPESFKQLAADDVILEGFVENLDTIFESCCIFVAPLLSGAGIKGKVLEAMASGIPTVLSNIAAEGTGLSNGINAFIAEKPQEWVDAIVKLYQDEQLWNEFSRNALKLAESNFSFEHGIEGMKKALIGVNIFSPSKNNALVSIQ